MIDEAQLEPTSEPNHQQQRRPVPTPLLPPGHGATPTLPRQDKTRTPLAINKNTSFRRNASSAAQSIRSSVVAAERHLQGGQRCGHLEPHRGNEMPRQPTALTSHHLVPSERSTVRSGRTPARRSVRSSTTSPGGLRFASTHLVHTGWSGQRADRPTSEHRERRNALHTSCRSDTPMNGKAVERQSPQAAFIATHEGVSHPSC